MLSHHAVQRLEHGAVSTILHPCSAPGYPELTCGELCPISGNTHVYERRMRKARLVELDPLSADVIITWVATPFQPAWTDSFGS